MDTLAEVYFQQGNRAKAVETIKKCIETYDKRASSDGTPMSDYLKRQLRRFQTLEASSEPE